MVWQQHPSVAGGSGQAAQPPPASVSPRVAWRRRGPCDVRPRYWVHHGAVSIRWQLRYFPPMSNQPEGSVSLQSFCLNPERGPFRVTPPQVQTPGGLGVGGLTQGPGSHFVPNVIFGTLGSPPGTWGCPGPGGPGTGQGRSTVRKDTATSCPAFGYRCPLGRCPVSVVAGGSRGRSPHEAP